jgi:hypothetical protein
MIPAINEVWGEFVSDGGREKSSMTRFIVQLEGFFVHVEFHRFLE